MSTSKFEGLEVLRDQVFTDAALLDYAAQLSEKSGALTERLLHWEFGPLMEMRHRPEVANYLFSTEAVPFHWDGAFYREPAKLLFYCTESEGTGGETLFTNTTLLWQSLSAEEQKLCRQVQLRYRTEKLAHYGGEITVPLVQQHPVTGAVILRLAEAVETQLNPVTLEILGIDHATEFYECLRDKLYHDEFMVSHQWQKGDLLICDNFTFLHGRRPLGLNLERSFKRIQIL